MRPVPVTLLTSCHPLAREAVLARLRVERPWLAIVRHELGALATDGCVYRVTHRGQHERDVAIGVGPSCCLSCLLRADTMAAVDDLVDEASEAIVVVLPAIVEPAAVEVALAELGTVEVRGLVVVVDASEVEGDLEEPGPSSLDGLPDPPEDRTVGEVLVRQLGQADVVVRAADVARGGALVDALAPAARVCSLDTPLGAWLDGAPRDRLRSHPAVPAAVTDPRPVRALDRHGVTTARWSRRRPLHPERFAEAVGEGRLVGVVSLRGHCWFATRPDTVLDLELTPGHYEVAAVGTWSGRSEGSGAVSAQRPHADAAWHPSWGDRHSDLAVVTLDRPADEVLAVLDSCCLTDEELARGEDGWRRLPDPFEGLGVEGDLLAERPGEGRP